MWNTMLYEIQYQPNYEIVIRIQSYHYYLCKKYIISLFQHISSKTQPNLKNYGGFVNSFEFVSNLDQPGPCSFIRLEMAAIWS